MDELELTVLPPRRRDELPRWSVRADGIELGQIETVRLRGARVTFYRALAVIPGCREMANLELDTDLEGQARKLGQFRQNPLNFARHLTRQQIRVLGGKVE